MSTESASPVRDYLAQINTKILPRPTAAVLYGPPGIGKTSIGAAIPGCIFMHDAGEAGIHTLKSAGWVSPDIPVLPPVTNWPMAKDMLRQLAQSDLPYKALVVDTIGGLEQLCHEHVCRTVCDNDWGEKGFGAFGRGVKASLPEWRHLIKLLDACREKGMSVLLLAHAIKRPYQNPAGANYDQFMPDLDARSWNLTHRWADMVIYCDHEDLATGSGPKKKGQSTGKRWMHTSHQASYEAKNRLGLPPKILMGNSGEEAWSNLKNAIAKSKGGK